jgi:hypothetical protein
MLAAAAALCVLAACNTQYKLPASDADAQALPVAWCADYGLDMGTNCGFATLEQCRAAVSGISGQCRPAVEATGATKD